MFDFKTYSDHELIQKTKTRVAEERAVTCDILEFLAEIQKRMLFAARGFSSLHEFCVRELGYTDGAAYRRISAMKLGRELPAAKTALEDGKLSLTTASQLQSFFDREKKERQKTYNSEEKSALVAGLAGASRVECEKKLAGLSPEAFVPKEKSRIVSKEGDTEIRFVASATLMRKIDRLKKLTAHRDPNPTHAALLECLVDLGLKTWDPAYIAPKTRSRSMAMATPTPTPTPESTNKPSRKKSAGNTVLDSNSCDNPVHNSDSHAVTESSSASSAKLAKEAKFANPPSRYISKTIRDFVWKRDQGCCTFTDPIAKRTCGSHYGLQLDHIIPFAKGGPSEAHNLRLLCHTHNTLFSRRHFGTAYGVGSKPH